MSVITPTSRTSHADRVAGPGALTGRAMSAHHRRLPRVRRAGKLLRIRPAVDGTRDLDFPDHSVVVIGVLLTITVVLYAIPRTAFLGALLTTAYLGGAVCANLRLDLPIVSHVLSPVYVAVILWAGLYLRSPMLREPVRSGR